MSSLKSLLAATDFSDDAEHAAYRAAMLTAEHSAQLRLLHVVSRSSVDALRVILRSHPGAEVAMIEELSVMLGDLAAQLATQTDSKVSTALEIGDVLDEILKASDPADLLVVGARGLNPIRDLLLGTTAERLLRKCRRPVLVVKQRPQGRYGKVLVAADLSPHSTAALELAVRLAPAASITVVHAFDVPLQGKLRLAEVSAEEIEQYRAHVEQQALKNVDALLEQFPATKDRFNRVVQAADPRRLILEQEKASEADLIVIGKHGALVEDLLIGSVTRHTLSHSRCDVLIEMSGMQ